MKSPHSLLLKSALCLLITISLPSCRLGGLGVTLSDRAEGLCNRGEYRNIDYAHDAPAHWRVLRDEIVKLIDNKGHTYYYVPLSISTTLRDTAYINYYSGGWSSRHLVDISWQLGAGDRTRAEAPKQVYAPLRIPENNKQAQRLLSALHLDSSKQAVKLLRADHISYPLDQLPKDYRQLSRIATPQLESKLRAAQYDFPAYSYKTETSQTGKIARVATTAIVDIPLSIVGITAGMIYENTLGLILSAFEQKATTE